MLSKLTLSVELLLPEKGFFHYVLDMFSVTFLIDSDHPLVSNIKIQLFITKDFEQFLSSPGIIFLSQTSVVTTAKSKATSCETFICTNRQG